MRRLLLVAAALALAASGSTSSSTSGTAAGSAPEAGAVGADDGTAPETVLRRFPGVEVREVGDGVEILVRGESSFLADQEPLFVVDGSPVSPGPGGSLVGIRVLKSASETSYGPRGANGVVLVMTRLGQR